MDFREVTKNTVCQYLKEGMSKKDSALMAGIDESTFYRWIKDDASFASQIAENILAYKRTLILKLNAYTDIDGKFALKILERRFPEDWGVVKDSREIENRAKLEEQKRTLADLLQSIYAIYDKAENGGIAMVS